MICNASQSEIPFLEIRNVRKKQDIKVEHETREQTDTSNYVFPCVRYKCCASVGNACNAKTNRVVSSGRSPSVVIKVQDVGM